MLQKLGRSTCQLSKGCHNCDQNVYTSGEYQCAVNSHLFTSGGITKCGNLCIHWNRCLPKMCIVEQFSIREQIAEIQHNIWAHWMQYLFSCCHVQNNDLVIPIEKVKRWQRQVNTNYQKLSNNEKESDRTQADKVLTVIRQKISNLF